MKQTTKVTCPRCGTIQAEDIIDLTEGDSLDGKFNHECDSCEENFTVEFEFIPHVKTYKLYKNF